MRNLLGRLHARHLPELLRIAETWGVPLRGESKGDVVGALYRAMTDPRTMRDIWSQLCDAERALVQSMADAPDMAPAPTIAEIAARLGVTEEAARDTALALYKSGILAREGDDDPLPIGMPPRVVLPREIALHVRRLQDEMASGDLTAAPLRVLLELLDDAELEAAARTWGLRVLPGAARRADLIARLMQLVTDRTCVERVVRGRSRDAAAIWRVLRAAETPVSLAIAAANAGLDPSHSASAARLRVALAELEGALLVWHAYGPGQSRRLFIPREIRSPGEPSHEALPPLVPAPVAGTAPVWKHPDALAWDLLTLLRIASDRQAPAWEVDCSVPRWLARLANRRFWHRGADAPPSGYLELLRSLAIAEGLLVVAEEDDRQRSVIGPELPAWRRRSFPEQTSRLRERWLRLPRWVEGEPAELVAVWGADWRGMRSRLLTALADPVIGVVPGDWFNLESLARRLAVRNPRLLGPSFSAATARVGSDAGAGSDDRDARVAALSDVISLELSGPFAWFGLTDTADAPGQPRSIRLTPLGAALAARKAPELTEPAAGNEPPLQVDPSGEISLAVPSPARVWALSALAEQTDLGRISHYRLTSTSIAAALAAGIEREQIVSFLERSGQQSLPPTVAEAIERWSRAVRRVRLRRALILAIDEESERPSLLQALLEGNWEAEPLAEGALLVALSNADPSDAGGEETRLLNILRAVKYAPVWSPPSPAAATNREETAPAEGMESNRLPVE